MSSNALCGGVVLYANVDLLYHVATFIGCVVLRHPAWQWPPLSKCPWTSTSILDFCNFCWHQVFRMFVVYDARPGGAFLGQPGPLLSTFGVSAVMHDLGMWGLERGTEFRTAGGFFLMGTGAALGHAF